MKSALLAGACGIALAATLMPGTAFAQTVPNTSNTTIDATQTTEPDAETGDDVIVTGSRAVTNGAQAPTPVTVVSTEQLAKAQPGLLAEGLNQLPALRGSTRPSTGFTSATGAGSGSYLNLRNLGAQRTLVLVNGNRFAPSARDGSTDINLIPEALIKRVDIVTGGASAAYGSDAVAGVVNLVLDTRFEGFKGDVQAGVSHEGDGGSQKASLAGGTSFADGRGHVIGSVGYFNVKGIDSLANRDWGAENYGFITNPANTRQLLYRPGLRGSTVSAGGLILSGPLAFQQFQPGGTLAPFNRGTLQSGSTRSVATARRHLPTSAPVFRLRPRSAVPIST